MPLGHYMSNVPARIIGPRFDPDAGGFTQRPVGTGFFVRVPSERLVGTFHGYLITAHHVIEREGEYEAEIANPDEPGRLYAPIATLEWKQPIARLDLVLAAFDPPDDYVVTAFEANFNLLPQLPIAAMLGAPMYYVGLLEPLDRQMARSGTLGALDQEGIEHQAGDYEYRSHLADCRSYTGFSGSPCILEYPVNKLTAQELPIAPPPDAGPLGRIIYLHVLCGMLTEHLDAYNAASKLEARSGVGIVLPSELIWQALMTPTLRAERLARDIEILRT